MNIHRRRTYQLLAGLIVIGTALAAVTSTASAGDEAKAKGELTIFSNTDDGGGPNPIQQGATAKVHSVEHDGSTTVTLHVKGLPPDRTFGAHVHKLACGDNQAGGHYMDDPSAPPSPENEIWLDFTTNPAGNGEAHATVPWTIRPGEAKAVAIHAHGTNEAGSAGHKLACLDVDFG